MSDGPPGAADGPPPPLTVAASLVAVQGMVLAILAVLEFANISDERRSLGLSTAGFFAGYGILLIGAGWALWRLHGWSRGPVLLTQLIALGLAWSLREHVAVAGALVLCAVIILAGMLNRASIEALDGVPHAGRDQSADSSE